MHVVSEGGLGLWARHTETARCKPQFKRSAQSTRCAACTITIKCFNVENVRRCMCSNSPVRSWVVQHCMQHWLLQYDVAVTGLKETAQPLLHATPLVLSSAALFARSPSKPRYYAHVIPRIVGKLTMLAPKIRSVTGCGWCLSSEETLRLAWSELLSKLLNMVQTKLCHSLCVTGCCL